MTTILERPSREVSRDTQSVHSDNLDELARMSDQTPLNFVEAVVEEEIKHDSETAEVPLLQPRAKLVSTDHIQQEYNSYKWDAGDDADEMNIGETRTDFAIHGIADC